MLFERINEKPLSAPSVPSYCFGTGCGSVLSRNLLIVDCHVTIVALNGSPPQLPSKDSHGKLLQERSVKSRNVRANVSAGGKTAHPRIAKDF